MYTLFLVLHNLLRWVVVLAGLAAAIKALVGWFGQRPWQSLDNRLGLIFTVSMDIQLLVGLILYVFLSPITQSAFDDFGAAMANGGLRYFAVEHIAVMVVAVILAHIGRALSRRATSDPIKHRQAAVFYTLAILAVLLATPWFRPLLRLG